MGNKRTIKDLVERDGRFGLVQLGRFYADPLEDPIRGVEPIFGAVLKGRHGFDERRPLVVVSLSEEFADADPEVVASALLDVAEGEVGALFDR